MLNSSSSPHVFSFLLFSMFCPLFQLALDLGQTNLILSVCTNSSLLSSPGWLCQCIASCEECVLNLAIALQMKLLVSLRQPPGHPLLEPFNFPGYGSSTRQTQKSVDSRPMLGYWYCACIAQDSASPPETRGLP